MKKYTKVLAAFCATAMIFGSFSATVFADEVAAGDQENSSEKPSDYYDAPSVREDAFAEGFESLDARVKRIEAENKDAQSGNNDTQSGVDDDYPEGYGIPGVNGSQVGTNGDQAGADGDQAGADGDQAGTDGTQSGTDEPKVDEKASADQMDDTKKDDDTKAEMAKKGAAEGQDAGSDPVDQPVNNPEEPEQVVLFANGVITQSDIDSNGFKMPETAGTYTLAENVTVPNSALISAAGSQVTIDLAGYTITYTGTENLYTVGLIEPATVNGHSSVLVHGNIVLTIKDSGSTGKIVAENTTTGGVDHWISIDGSYPKYGTEDGHRGGCILVQNSCTFKLEGGTISGFHSQSDGGAIHVSNGGACVMTGGRITDCHSDSKKPNDDGAGAISCHCTSKGTSIGNALLKTSEDEEAVVTTISLKGSLKITGGKIDSCSGKQGGAIRILRADFEISGGTIENNTGLNGGGILFVTNGKGTFKISGNPVISGNSSTSEAKKANVWLNDGATITLNGNLDSTAKIEFGTSTVSNNVFNTNGKTYSIDSFVCNHAGYYAYVSGSYIKLKQGTLPKVEAYQLVIAGDIKMRAALDLGTFADSNTSVNYAYSYTKGSKTVNISKTVAFSSLGTNGSLYTVDIPVESACITSPITVTINYSDGEVSDDPVTIERYVKVILDGDYSQKIKDVAWSLWIFGSIAMLQFNINTNDPALHPADWEVNGNLYDPAHATKYTIGEGAAYAPANDPDGAFYGASVNFLSKTEVNLYFKKSALDATAPTMTVTYSDNSSETISATENGSYYVYTVKGPSGEGFAATVFDVPFNFSVGNVSGEYSVNTYLQFVEYKYHGDSNNILLKLVEAYYDFARKCQQL